MANTITINLEHLGQNYLRLLADISASTTGFPINADIWAYLLGHKAEIIDQARKERNKANETWADEYLEEGWEDMVCDSCGYLSIAHLIENAADATRADEGNLFKAGAFDALAEAGATFLADEYHVSQPAAKRAIYDHCKIDF